LIVRHLIDLPGDHDALVGEFRHSEQTKLFLEFAGEEIARHVGATRHLEARLAPPAGAVRRRLRVREQVELRNAVLLAVLRIARSPRAVREQALHAVGRL
jgi:hypothetical protein